MVNSCENCDFIQWKELERLGEYVHFCNNLECAVPLNFMCEFHEELIEDVPKEQIENSVREVRNRTVKNSTFGNCIECGKEIVNKDDQRQGVCFDCHHKLEDLIDAITDVDEQFLINYNNIEFEREFDDVDMEEIKQRLEEFL